MLDAAPHMGQTVAAADERQHGPCKQRNSIMGRIMAICTSQKKGTAKKAVDYAKIIENHGIEGDAHAGNWHRQVSLLSWQAIEAF